MDWATLRVKGPLPGVQLRITTPLGGVADINFIDGYTLR